MIFITLWMSFIFFQFKTSQQNAPFGLIFFFFCVSLRWLKQWHCCLSSHQAPPYDVLVMWVLPLISVGMPSWPLSTQKELTRGPTRAAVTFGWRGPLLPGFGSGGDRAAHWVNPLCPGAPAATANYRAVGKGFSTHCLSLCTWTEAIYSVLKWQQVPYWSPDCMHAHWFS